MGILSNYKLQLKDGDITLKYFLIALLVAGAHFHGSNLSGSTFVRSKFSETNLTQTNFSHANLSATDLTNVDLSGANLQYSYVYGSRLTSVNFIS